MSLFIGDWDYKDDGKTIVGKGITWNILPAVEKFDEAISNPVVQNTDFKSQIVVEGDRVKQTLVILEQADLQRYEKFQKALNDFGKP